MYSTSQQTAVGTTVGRFLDYPTYYECCKKGYRGSDLPPGCRKGRHHNKHHGDYPYENYFKHMEEQVCVCVCVCECVCTCVCTSMFMGGCASVCLV